ncbi:MAG: ATP-dependent Clp protease ATP-binding subunit ClpX, partial [Ruminococcus sp.]|nr:ATP-dependent Clp protease ATP-binding subunit ClpX [Ruminococcus sp.]
VKQYKNLFEMDNIKLRFTDDALRAIADKAIKQETGARGLRGIMESILKDLMFETPSDTTIEKIIITKAVVTDKEQPQITRKKEKSAFSLKMPKKEKRSKRSSAS